MFSSFSLFNNDFQFALSPLSTPFSFSLLFVFLFPPPVPGEPQRWSFSSFPQNGFFPSIDLQEAVSRIRFSLPFFAHGKPIPPMAIDCARSFSPPLDVSPFFTSWDIRFGFPPFSTPKRTVLFLLWSFPSSQMIAEPTPTPFPFLYPFRNVSFSPPLLFFFRRCWTPTAALPLITSLENSWVEPSLQMAMFPFFFVSITDAIVTPFLSLCVIAPPVGIAAPFSSDFSFSPFAQKKRFHASSNLAFPLPPFRR